MCIRDRVRVAPNGVVPSCKLATALRYANGNNPINYTASDINECREGPLMRFAHRSGSSAPVM
eukprot:656867-Heterocapsa_arctica.AAC.1